LNNNDNSSAVNREQQPKIDPVLVTTIHCNKGAIDIIHGQITELKHDVNQLQTKIHNQKSSTTTTTQNRPSKGETRRVSKSDVNNLNQTSISHHHHHHHHGEAPVPPKRSSFCNVL
jgi:hypothetical protein